METLGVTDVSVNLRMMRLGSCVELVLHARPSRGGFGDARRRVVLLCSILYLPSRFGGEPFC